MKILEKECKESEEELRLNPPTEEEIAQFVIAQQLLTLKYIKKDHPKFPTSEEIRSWPLTGFVARAFLRQVRGWDKAKYRK